VPANTASSFNVKANDSDPDGDALTIPTIIVAPVNGIILNVADNGTVTYKSDSNLHSTNHQPVDSFKYYICDTLAAHLPRPLCDTAEVYIYIPKTLFAVNDTAQTGCHTPVVICVKNNDYDTNGDSFTVKGIVTAPAHGTASLDSITHCVLYTPDSTASSFPGGLIDSFRYYDQDAMGSTDSAWVYVKVICCSINAVNDTFTVAFGDSIYAHVTQNDTYNDSFSHAITVVTGSGPANGTATVIGDTILYVPRIGFCGTDAFRYVLSDICGQDTALVTIHVSCDTNCRKPIAVNDTVQHGYVCGDTIDVLLHDVYTENAIVTVIVPPLHGSDTVIGNNIVYTPDGEHANTTDSLVYMLCNACGRCDTAVLFIELSGYPCNVFNPIARNITDTICRNTLAVINVLAQDSDPNGESLYIHLVASASHGNATNVGDTIITYQPDSNFVGIDSFIYQICNTGIPNLCTNATVYIKVNSCLPAPIVLDTLIYDTTTVCTAKQFCIDSIYQGSGYTVRFFGFCDSASHGSVILSTDTALADSTGMLCFTYTPDCDTVSGSMPYVGNDTMCLIICDTGPDTVCTITHVIITILPKPPVDSIWANPDVTYTCNQPDTIHVLDNDGFLPNPGNSQTGTRIYVLSVGTNAGKAPDNGTVTIGVGDSTVIYVPNPNFVGYDTFKYVITNNGSTQLFDTSTVYVYACLPPHPIAVNDNPSCLDTTGYVDQPAIINILGNDTLFPATDTAIYIIDSTMHGRIVINPDFTVTYTPDSGFHGNDNFSYQVVEFVGSVIGYSDTASVCIDIVDTSAMCFFPNGISPNGDGVNDVFAFPCNEMYPNASLQIFNRWGDPIWISSGGYKNDWGGTNQQGHPVPDGTYYFIYKYNDGSGRSVARFVVVYRGAKQ
jgi:gliding motility-associated-like protein